MNLVLESGFLIDAASLAGSAHENQDTWGRRREVFWVLDGATASASNNKLTVADFVTSLDAALYQHADSDASLRTILRSALDSIATHPATQAGFSTTVAMAKYTASGWEWLVLGDAAVVFRGPRNRLRLVSDQRLEQVAGDLRAQRRAAQGNPAAVAEFEKLTVALRREEERWRNLPGGFWVAGAVPDAAAHALEGTVPGSTRMHLLTDGVTDGLRNNHWPSSEAAVAESETTGVKNSLENMRRSLLDRYGIVDDATLVRIQADA